MNSKFKFRSLAAIATTALLAALSAHGSVNEALKDYQRGKFSKARSEFERLARKSPEDARLRYNAGAAAFRDEDYDTALKHFSAGLAAPDLKLQEQSYYNLGNTYFRLGEKADDSKSKQVQWEQAIRQYETALKLDPNDEDAKTNIEVVKQKLEELKQQQQEKQDQPKDQDQNKDEQQKQQEQQNKDEQKKDEQQKQDKSEQEKQDQQKQEQEKKDQQSQQQQQQQQQSGEQKQQEQQQAQDQRGKEPGQDAQEQNYARVMQMTPQQAQQLLDAQKGEERAMIFQPQATRTNKPRDRVFKDW